MNSFEISFLFFAFLGALLGVLFLMRSRGDRTANRLLGIYLMLFGFNLGFNTLFWSKLLYTEKFIHFFGLNAVPWLCYGPLFYLYLQRILKKKVLGLKDLLHFIPLFIYLFSKLPFYILNASEKLGSLEDRSYIDYGFSTLHTAYFAMGLMLIYGILAIGLRSKYRPALIQDKRIWVHFLIVSFFGYLLTFVTYFARIELGYYSIFSDYILCYFILLFVGTVAYFGIVQPQVFEGTLPMNKVIPFVKYERTGLSENYSLELKTRLLQLMEDEKPYLDSDLRLNDIAKTLDISRHHASQVINEHFKMNFFDFVNQHRIREAEKLLLQKNHVLNVRAIAYQSGFNSRASFYKAFKKLTGITPKEYRRHNLAS